MSDGIHVVKAELARQRLSIALQGEGTYGAQNRVGDLPTRLVDWPLALFILAQFVTDMLEASRAQRRGETSELNLEIEGDIGVMQHIGAAFGQWQVVATVPVAFPHRPFVPGALFTNPP